MSATFPQQYDSNPKLSKFGKRLFLALAIILIGIFIIAEILTKN